MNMIYKVFPGCCFGEEAWKLTKQLATLPTLALALSKQALNESYANNLYQQLEVEDALQRKAGSSEDYEEGVQAFLENETQF